jgi:diguanylate cyclase
MQECRFHADLVGQSWVPSPLKDCWIKKMAGVPIGDMDVEYARTVSDRAIRAMSEHSVPVTPNNFSVWFNYAMGASQELRKTIDILIGNKRKFDAATNRQLYVTYIDAQSDPTAAADFPDQLRGLIAGAKTFLATAISDNRTQIETLGEVSSQVAVTCDPRPIIETLVNELTKATARASTLEANFLESSQELDKIRDSLKTAEQLSNTDALTGLANRRSFEDFFRSAQISAMETGNPLSIVMIDIDHFKKFNDSYGHQVGDQVLRLVAKVLQESVRDVDLAARYGGEELIAVLPGADLDRCAEAAERIRRRIAEGRLTRRSTGKEIASVTVSIGVAQFQLAEAAEATIERCDRALYQAKRAGRNRVVTENEIDSEIAAA